MPSKRLPHWIEFLHRKIARWKKKYAVEATKTFRAIKQHHSYNSTHWVVANLTATFTQIPQWQVKYNMEELGWKLLWETSLGHL